LGPDPVRVAKKWSKLPKGWTQESVDKFWGTLTDKAPKHPVSRCIREMEGKVSNPGAFCGGLADQMIPGWREKDSKKACGDGPCECGGECGCGGSPLQSQPDYGTSGAAVPRAASVVDRYAARGAERKLTPAARKVLGMIRENWDLEVYGKVAMLRKGKNMLGTTLGVAQQLLRLGFVSVNGYARHGGEVGDSYGIAAQPRRGPAVRPLEPKSHR
jgi:hypothetical protein